MVVDFPAPLARKAKISPCPREVDPVNGDQIAVALVNPWTSMAAASSPAWEIEMVERETYHSPRAGQCPAGHAGLYPLRQSISQITIAPAETAVG